MHNGFLYSASEYKTFLPLLTDPIKDYTVANKYATLFMKMQVEVFGTKSFKITDEELFKYKDIQTGTEKRISELGVLDNVVARHWLVITLPGGCQQLWFNDDDDVDVWADDEGWYLGSIRGNCGGGGGSSGGGFPSSSPGTGTTGNGDPWSGSPTGDEPWTGGGGIIIGGGGSLSLPTVGLA